MHVLIAGGGIAGSVTAMALQQAGIEATIFESHPQSDADVGSYFTVSPNGLDALAAIGALDLVTPHGLPTRRNILVDADGKRLGVTGLGNPLAVEHLIPDFLVNLEATFDPSFPVGSPAERPVFKIV